MFKSLLIFCILICLHSNLKADSTVKLDKEKKVAVLRTDTSELTLRSFNAKALDNYRKSRGFNYGTLKKASNWWDAFWQWVWLMLEKFFGAKVSKTNYN